MLGIYFYLYFHIHFLFVKYQLRYFFAPHENETGKADRENG